MLHKQKQQNYSVQNPRPETTFQESAHALIASMQSSTAHSASVSTSSSLCSFLPFSFLQSIVCKIADFYLFILYFVVKSMVIPFVYALSSSLCILQPFSKLFKLFVTFFYNGIQGVQRTFKFGAFSQMIHYAILKENGQYLKMTGKSLEEVFTCQLYDYAIRRFMSVSQLQEEMRVTEIQFWSTVGLKYVKQKFNIKHVSGLTNSREKISRFRSKSKQIQLKCTEYTCQSPLAPNSPSTQDIFLFFNRSRSGHNSHLYYYSEQEQHRQQIDMIKVLGFIKKNLSQTGYAVIGNYFTSQGDAQVFQEILDGFGFKIQMKEDITPNILHSKKVLARIHKNRKIAWLLGKTKETIIMIAEHDNFLCNFVRKLWKIMMEALGVKGGGFRYNLYILEHSM